MRVFITRLLRFVFIGLIPVSVFFVLYLYFDPFKVLRKYNDFSLPFVISNRDYISTEIFLKGRAIHNYNSFILGSSRTMAFRPADWKKYLEDGSNPFSFDASGESIYGIYTKLKFLDSNNVDIKNCLIVLCRDVSFAHETNHSGHLFIKHPITTKESNLSFQLEFVKAYFDLHFLKNYYTYLVTKQYSPFMKGYIEDRKVLFDSVTNEVTILDQEQELAESEEQYYEKRKDMFYHRNGEIVDSNSRISLTQQRMLLEIKNIFMRHNTNYKVVISPLYEQIKFNNKDIDILVSVFSDNLYDFSGKNSFTENKMNYYENSHYRPFIGDRIMSVIYKK